MTGLGTPTGAGQSSRALRLRQGIRGARQTCSVRAILLHNQQVEGTLETENIPMAVKRWILPVTNPRARH